MGSKCFNILVEQNNTSAVTCSYFTDKKYRHLNTGYFNFKNSLVSVDIDGKHYKLSSGYRKQFSRIYKLAFGDKESLRFNILDEIEKDTAYNDAFEIANILVKDSDISSENSFMSSNVRDFLITLILHVKCSDLKDKSLYGCFNCLFNYGNDEDNDDKMNIFLENIHNSIHCSNEIHESISSSIRRFKNMNKETVCMVYQKALSILSIFQNNNLRIISSQSDFCIKDFVIGKPKSL